MLHMKRRIDILETKEFHLVVLALRRKGLY
jgi:hypothetical protein